MAARQQGFLQDRKRDINPDLQKERDTATVRVEELTNILDGGLEKSKRRRELENLLFTGENAEVFSSKKWPFMSRSELYEAGIARSSKLFHLRNNLAWADEVLGLAFELLNYDLSLLTHDGMFIPGLERLGNDEQQSVWLPLARSGRIIGTYAQTELGHGTNLMGLETTATFDPATDEFVVNSPHISSMKWWPGGLGKTATHALIMAQLVIGGRRHGLQAFLVPLRSLEDHTVLPGVELGDIGPKLGWNQNDNGYMILKKVRIPRNNMMMRNASVSKDGKFTPLASEKANYATMVLVRASMVRIAYLMLRNGACAAVRYSSVRRQTTLKPGTQEQQVLDFQTQQYKLFPCLAATYATFFTAEAMNNMYQAAHAEIMTGNFSQLQELHVKSSALKAFVTDMTAYELEVARRACGGHGYLMSAGFGRWIATSQVMVTGEGENTVLFLQTARYLMKQIASVLAGIKSVGHTAYLNSNLQTYLCPLQTLRDCRNPASLTQLYKHRALSLVLSAAKLLQQDLESGKPQDIAFNNNMVALVRAAKAHSHLIVVESFIEGIEKLESNCSPELFQVLTSLGCFFTIHGIVTSSGDFLETETVGLTQMEWLRAEELNLLAMLRPNAVALSDAFDLHDETVASVLGQYDGNAYQHLYESTQHEALNKTKVHPSYYKYLQGLIKGPPAAKL